MVGTDASRPDEIKHVSRPRSEGAGPLPAEAPPPRPLPPPRLTESSVVGQLLVNLLHPLDVQSAALGVVYHGLGVIHPHHAVGRLLDRLRGIPGLVEVPVWVVLQDGYVAPAGHEHGWRFRSGRL